MVSVSEMDQDQSMIDCVKYLFYKVAQMLSPYQKIL